MVITGSSFDYAGSEFRLHSLLDINMVAKKDEIEEVTDGADKQVRGNPTHVLFCHVLTCTPQHSCAFCAVLLHWACASTLKSLSFSFFHFISNSFLHPFSSLHFFSLFSLPLFNFSSSLPLYTHSQHTFLTPTPTLSTPS